MKRVLAALAFTSFLFAIKAEADGDMQDAMLSVGHAIFLWLAAVQWDYF
jgi:hypothetical protein